MLTLRNKFSPWTLVSNWIAIALVAGIAANAFLVLGVPWELRAVGATLLIFVLPGVAALAIVFPRGAGILLSERIVLSVGAGVALSVMLLWALWLSPLRLQFHTMLGALDFVIVLLAVVAAFENAVKPRGVTLARMASERPFLIALLVVCLTGLFFTLVNLPFLEYVADERTVVSIVLDILMDKKNALFDLPKGPAQIFLAAWFVQLTDSWWEGIVRLPFALCGMAAAACFMLIARIKLSTRVALLAGLLLIVDGLVLGLARWAQYQMIVLLMMHLALYCGLRGWLTRDTGKSFRYWLLCAGFWGVGLLTHYDALFIGPALLYLFIHAHRRRLHVRTVWLQGLSLGFVFALLGMPFYLMFAFRAGTPQAMQAYLAARVGPSHAPFNQLRSFFIQWVYYDSSYKVLVILLLALLAIVSSVVAYTTAKRKPDLVLAATGIGILSTPYVIWQPGGLTVAGVNLSFVPVVLASVLLIFKVIRDPFWKLVSIWAATIFAFTGFLMSDPRDHFFGAIPALLLISSQGLTMAAAALRRKRRVSPLLMRAATMLVVGWLAAGAAYAYLLQTEHFPTLLDAHPELLPAWFSEMRRPEVVTPWVPDNGWRAIAVLYEQGILRGEYDSDLVKFPDWYLHRVWWPAQRTDRYYFVAGPSTTDSPPEQQAPTYDLWGTVTVEGDQRLRIYQRKESTPPVPRVFRAEDYEPAWQRLATLSRLQLFKANQRDDSAFFALAGELGRRGAPADALAVDIPQSAGILSLYFTGSYPFLDMRQNPDLSPFRRIWGIFWGISGGEQERALAARGYALQAQWFGNVQLRPYWIARDGVQEPVGARLGEVAKLLSTSAVSAQLQAGDVLPLALIWQAEKSGGERYKVFVHVVNAAGQLAAQVDDDPQAGLRPTSQWVAGEQVVDRLGIVLPQALAPGHYSLLAGMYDPESGARLPALSRQGDRYQNDAVSLGDIVVVAR